MSKVDSDAERRNVRHVLGQLQNRRGEPSLRTRATAALVIVGLVVLTAPLVVIPVIGWVTEQLF